MLFTSHLKSTSQLVLGVIHIAPHHGLMYEEEESKKRMGMRRRRRMMRMKEGVL